jgi:Tfp pilus assembly protein PilV
MRHRAAAGFTLVEIMIATTVMVMLSVFLLSYVDFGSSIWRRGHQRMNLLHSSRAVHDLLARDLSQATKIIDPDPDINIVRSYIVYEMPVRTVSGAQGIIRLSLRHIIPTRTLIRVVEGSSLTLQSPTSPMMADATKVNKSQYEFMAARNVATFTVTRVSSWTVQVNLGLESIEVNQVDPRSLSLEGTATYLMPGAI